MNSTIKVMLVDDSAVIRGLLARTLEQEPRIDIVASVSNGEMAVSIIDEAKPDVVILDIEMPVMDGITAIPLLLQKRPEVKILMCSTLSEKGAEITLKALTLGATDCIAKPTTTSDISSGVDFQEELLRLIKALGNVPANDPTSAPQQNTSTVAQETQPSTADKTERSDSITLRNEASDYTGKPDIIAIGSSTGGPQALFKVLSDCKDFDIPIIITQHMPKTFTKILARHITTNCQLEAHEGEDGMVVEPGKAYVAPGGFHMELVRDENETSLKIIDTPPENFCKPSVDPMIRSALKIYGQKMLGVMLTGMGNDGFLSFSELTQAGGRVIAQDEKTSVVWGMPGAVATEGICTAVLPLDDIGPWVKNAVQQ